MRAPRVCRASSRMAPVSALSPVARRWRNRCWRCGRAAKSRKRSCASNGLLARPDDAVDEGDFAEREIAVLECRIEAFQFDALGGHAAKLFGHHFARVGLDHDTVAAPERPLWRHEEAVAVAIDRQHGIAGDLQRITMSV